MSAKVSTKRNRANLNASDTVSAPQEASTTSASKASNPKWNGFCEIESEPALFNAMLQKFGVRGVKVKEVVSLDSEMLAFLPWTDQESDKQEQSCPDDIWFANQTSNNSCASVALLNIVNNVPGIDLGHNLHAFKDFTKDFTPALRGDAINNFQFVKDIHNSFARKMDMLNADLLLKNEANAKIRGKKGDRADDDSVAGFHFIAFMPIHGSLWKFDGLERQPMSLGESQPHDHQYHCVKKIGEGHLKGDWLEQAAPDIQARMAQYEENQIEFAVLSLVKDPVIDLLSALAENVQAILATQSCLDTIKPDWQSFTTDLSDGKDQNNTEKIIIGPDPGLLLTNEHILLASPAERIASSLQDCEPTEALNIRKELITTQRGLKLAIQEEIQSRNEEDEKARERTKDFGAKIQTFAQKVRRMEVR